jgi:hypothetical protein
MILSYTVTDKNSRGNLEIQIERTLSVWDKLKHLWKEKSADFPESKFTNFECVGRDMWTDRVWKNLETGRVVTDDSILLDLSRMAFAHAYGLLTKKRSG